jgi:hypothetical protein
MSERLQYRFGFKLDRDVWGVPQIVDKLRREHRKISTATIGREIQKIKRVALRQFFKSEGANDFPGVHIVAEWRNPDRKASQDWRSTEDSGQSTEDFYKTLHGTRGALRKAHRALYGG